MLLVAGIVARLARRAPEVLGAPTDIGAVVTLPGAVSPSTAQAAVY
jgi:hypothetical protein